MKRRLLLLNLLLLALIAAGVSSLRERAAVTRSHEEQVLKKNVPPAKPPVLPAVPQVAPVPATAYVDVANHVLFAKDRSPNPIVEPPKPVPVKVMPPLPFAYGILDFGTGPTVIMAEKSGTPHHGYHIGDKVGDFKLLAVEGRELTLEWDGKEIKKKLEDLVDKNAAATANVQAATTVAAAKTLPPPPKEPELAPEPKPGKDVGGGFMSCRPGDTSPNGTIADGYKKVVVANPFGSSCQWVPVKQ